jgi:predicted nucleic-acid-binding protein
MIGIDTNVVVRFLTLDPPDQARKARDLIAANDVFVSLTVILETEWVLRDAYELTRDEIARELGRFCALERVTVGEPAVVGRALRWAEAGLDFADALHLAQDEAFAAFATFDKKLVRRARALESVEVRAP